MRRRFACFRNRHPKFLDDKIPWLERDLTDAEVRATPIDREDARLALARWYEFQDWRRLEEYVASVQQPGPIARFERAVEAVIDGDIATLKRLLAEDPELVRARSTRVNNFDPPMHRSTLLHYLAANGVEGLSPALAEERGRSREGPARSRRRSERVVVGVRRAVHDDGAAGVEHAAGRCRRAGAAGRNADRLRRLDLRRRVRATGPRRSKPRWCSASTMRPQALVRRGAPIESLAAAAGLGRIDDVKRMLPRADEHDRHRALALAAQCGHAEVVGVLLDAGEDPNRFNPPGTHAHTPPIHQAIAAGHLDVVKLLVDRGARLDIKDTIYQGTPLGWAKYCDQPADRRLPAATVGAP